ncbi:MAG: DUF4239 domain-containing protein [Gammaproteobacteria bacterium]
MHHLENTLLFCLGLFVAIMLALEAGRVAGIAFRRRHPGESPEGSGAAEGAVFALLGLLIAFTFSGAAERFEERRHLIAEEANDIGTAWLRLDLLQPEAQPSLRDSFRRYLDLRIDTFRHAEDAETTASLLAESAVMQERIWRSAVEATRLPGSHPDAAKLLLPSLNEMIDITTTRQVATRNHPPVAIYLMLAGLGITAGLLIGYELSGRRHRPWLHILVFGVVMGATLYVILDLEYPRLGLIRIDGADQVLIDLRSGMD